MSAIPNKSLEFLAGGGKMGMLIREFDWESNALGKPETWPQSLKTCVRIMLSSKQPIWIGWGRGLVKLYNDPYIDIVRGKHPQALGQPASAVWKDIWKDIEPLLERAMTRDEGTYVESQLLIMERSGFPEETYYTFSYTPVLGDDGKPEGIICYNTADTDRIINERVLRTMQQLETLGQKGSETDLYRQAIQALATNDRDFPFSALYKIESDGTVANLVASAGFRSGFLSAESNVDDHAEIRVAVAENRIVETVFDSETGRVSNGAWDVPARDIVYVPIQSGNKKKPHAILALGLNPYRQFDESYRNFVQLIADRLSLGISNVLAYEEERKRAEALEEISQAKTLFFTNISHEFRTPLMLMLGSLEELTKYGFEKLDWKDRRNVEVSHRNALRLLKLVNTLLDFSRIESGKKQAHYVRTELGDFTNELASNFRSVIEKGDLEFRVDILPLKAPLYVDRSMWERIVFNLLSNAFKYTLTGHITLTLTEEADYAVLLVEDSGVGIPPDEIPKMFDRFHRIQQSGGRTYEGTGIGLSLVKELVGQHKGDISVESELGKGSVFKVRVPFGKKHFTGSRIYERDDAMQEVIANFYVQEATAMLDSPDDEPALSPKEDVGEEVVLIVDDNADMRRYIESQIATKYRTILAVNGLDALDKMKEHKPSLILSDIMMPEMDGTELLKRVKGNPDTAQVPVILITARAGEESKIEGIETGADDYLVKPFASNELMARVKAQIRIGKTRRMVEERLEGFLMKMPAVVAIIKAPDYRFMMVNEMFRKLFAPPLKELKGLTVMEAFPGPMGEAISELYDEVYILGEPLTKTDFQVSWQHLGQAWTGYFDMVIYPIKDEEGNVSELMLHAVETTVQVEAKRAIEASEEQFRTLTETIPQMVWMTDASGRQLFASHRWIEYSGVMPMDGASWKLILHPDDVVKVADEWSRCLASGTTYSIEIRLKNLAGEYRWHFGQGEPIRNEEGEIVNWIGTFTDIHEKRVFTDALEVKVQQRTQDLMNANKELESFNYIASHDLQEPLRKIQTFIHLIQKNQHDQDAVRRFYEKIDLSAQRMSELIQSVLTYSRLSKTGEDFTPVDLNKILNDVRTDFELLIAEKGAVLKVGKLPVIKANALQMTQLFSNLISNSLKFSKENPVISVESSVVSSEELPFELPVSPRQRYCHLTVSDNGIGFEPDFRDKIFQLFQRLHGKHEYSGTGIGLTIVKKIVEKHNGYISADSDLGSGATFHIWIPI